MADDDLDLFVDDEFPAELSSIDKNGGDDLSDIEWMRPKKICSLQGTEPVFLENTGSRHDLVQGNIGDCAVVAAAACLTQNPTLFEKIVPPGQGFDDGQYTGEFHFQFYKYDNWHSVKVDDRLPTRDGKLIYIRSENGNVFWGSLLEKAYAKFHGSYAALSGENAAAALSYFTGNLVEFCNLSKKSIHNISSLPNRLFECFAKQSIAVASTRETGSDESRRYENGLMSNHAYSVIAIRASGSCDGTDSISIRLRDPLCTPVELKCEQADSLNKDDPLSQGEFCVKFQEFRNYFSCIEICHAPENWNTYVIEGSWTESSSGGYDKYPEYFSNPQYLLETQEGTDEGPITIAVELTQKGRPGPNNTYLHIGVHLYVLTAGSALPMGDPGEEEPMRPQKQTHKPYQARAVMERHELTRPGRFLVVPYTSECGELAEFMIRIISDQPLNHQIIQ